MKKNLFLCLVLFLLTYGIQAQLSWTVADGDPTLLANKTTSLPVWGEEMHYDQHNQMIYLAGSISPLLGANITKLTFYSTVENQSWNGATGEIKLMHTTESSFPWGGIDASSATEVYTGAVAIVDNLMTFTFFTPFTYTGDNLLIDITTHSQGVYAGAEFYGLPSNVAYGCRDGLPFYFYTKITFEYYPASVPVYILSASSGAGGSITPSGDMVVGEHQNKRFDFIPDANHVIKKVLIDGVEEPSAVVNSYYEFVNITADHTIHAEFEAATGTYYTITTSAGMGGKVTPGGNVIVPEHQSKKFEFPANEDYILSTVLIDNVENEQAVNDGYYLFTDVTANHTVHADFTATGGVIIIADDTQINATVPVSTSYMDCSQHVQMLYPAEFIEELLDKKITKVSYLANTAWETFGDATGTIKIMHTTANDLISGFLNTDQATEVYSGPFALVSCLMEFPFSTPYHYTGGNLLIDVTTVAPPGEPRNIIFYGTSTSNISRYSFTFEGVFYNNLHPFTPKTMFKYSSADITSYTITATAGTGGTINPSGDVVVMENQNKRFDFYPDQNYTLSKVLIDNEENEQAVSDGYYIFTNVTDDHTIHAEFTVTDDTYYIITATAGEGGTINPNGDVVVLENEEQRFDFYPDQNYTLSKVVIDNEENEQAVSDGYYIFTNVTEDHTIHAEFLQLEAIVENALHSVLVYVYHNYLYIINERQILLSKIEIMDITGRVVYHSSTVTTPIHLNFAQGVYMVRLSHDDFAHVTKIIIQ
ncbi:MAG: T9SS type A sorting domain-containing protein [Bacteroidales bacterium]|nr:T9SS type A sorting domain-containing protein [Bacteroidales bacterium]